MSTTVAGDATHDDARPSSAWTQRTLNNGLRTLLLPMPSVPVAAVAVVYGVGMRSEPPGRAGFAHLFEHLMFEGSRHVPAGGHARLIQEVGGVFNGTTHADRTVFHQVLPTHGVERALFLEADRMAAPTLETPNLERQQAIVREEITSKVHAHPFSRFPRAPLCAAMFDRFANAHDGMGALADVEAATATQAREFFNEFYGPANAILAVVGDIDPNAVDQWIDRYFGSIPARPAPSAPDLDEADVGGRGRIEETDTRAPCTALGIGWRVPNPRDDLRGHLAHLVLADMLGGELGRLVKPLTGGGLATGLSARVDLTGEELSTCEPTGSVITTYLTPGTGPDTVLDIIDREVAQLAAAGPSETDVTRTKILRRARHYDEAGHASHAAIAAATGLLIHGDSALPGALPQLIDDVTVEDVAAAAATLTPERRTTCVLAP